MIHLKMKNIMKSRKTTDSTRRKGRDAQADPDEDYLDQDYDDYDNEEEERIRRIKNKVLVRVSYLMVALFLSMAGYLIYFNVVLRDDINNNQYNTKQSAYQEQIIRGNIYSADGNVLALQQLTPLYLVTFIVACIASFPVFEKSLAGGEMISFVIYLIIDVSGYDQSQLNLRMPVPEKGTSLIRKQVFMAYIYRKSKRSVVF